MIPNCHPKTSFMKDQKIRLCLDHNSKERKNPVYGYIVAAMVPTDPLGACTEEGNTIGEEVYLIQTSWSGGALWYTRRALMPTGGKNELAQWRQNWSDYLAAEKLKEERCKCH